MEWANFALNAVSVLLGLIGGAFGAWIISLYKEQKTQALASNDQAVQIYRELFEKLCKKVEELEKNTKLLEQAYFEVKEENFRLKVTRDQK